MITYCRYLLECCLCKKRRIDGVLLYHHNQQNGVCRECIEKMNKIYVRNCDPCYRCGNFAHYYVDHTYGLWCSNCLWYIAQKLPQGFVWNITPIPYATYNPWLYEDYWKNDPEKQQMFRNTMIINGYEEVEKHIWRKKHGLQGDTHSQEG